MPHVTAEYSVDFDRFLAQFPAIQEPEYRGTDFLAEFGQLQTDGDNDLCWDAVANAVYPRRLFVPHDNLFTGGPAGGGAFPTVNWGTLNPSGGLVAAGQLTNPHQYQEIQCGYTSMTQPPTGAFTAATGALSPQCQGFSFLYNVGAEKTDPTTASYLMLKWNIGTPAQNSGTWYGLVAPVGAAPYLVRATGQNGVPGASSSAWIRLGQIEPGGRKDQHLYPFQVQPLLHFEVWFLGGMMQCAFDSGILPWSFPECSPIINGSSSFPWTITQLALECSHIDKLRFSAHPTKFPRTVPLPGKATFQSTEQTLGFLPTSDPTMTVQYAPNPDFAPLRDAVANTTGFTPPGSSATAVKDSAASQSNILVYDLFFTNPQSTAGSGSYQGISYSDYTAAVRHISYKYPLSTIASPSSPTSQFPEQITVQWEFDFSSLQVRSSADLVFNNFKGITGPYLDELGHFAVTIAMGINGGAPATLFTGIANTDFEETGNPGGDSRVRMGCMDGFLTLQTEVANLPLMDGWNIYYAAYFLGQLGGFTKDRMAFKAFIPDDPYGDTPGGGETFFLPVGPRGEALTRFQGVSRPGDILQKIAKNIGYMTYTDQFNFLHFEKFIPPAPTPLMTFHHVDSSNLDGMWRYTYSGHLRDSRNIVNVVGTDKDTWRPLVSHQIDAKIWDDTQPTFQGYRNPLIWVDSQFANTDFAEAAAKDMLAYLRWPTRLIQFDTWMPLSGFVAPLDVIAIDNPRSGAHGKNFIVYGVRYHLQKGVAPTMTVMGRWFFPN